MSCHTSAPPGLAPTARSRWSPSPCPAQLPQRPAAGYRQSIAATSGSGRDRMLPRKGGLLRRDRSAVRLRPGRTVARCLARLCKEGAQCLEETRTFKHGTALLPEEPKIIVARRIGALLENLKQQPQQRQLHGRNGRVLHQPRLAGRRQAAAGSQGRRPGFGFGRSCELGNAFDINVQNVERPTVRG